ncbi:MAG: type 4a pilus biogenesis protein PilO [Candidatus Pacebacteria bacterium]|nr:type 4a pilus biogenesis protein PilO [Candidatus Paceibacterota bacterium]
MANKINLTLVVFLLLIALATAFIILPLFQGINDNAKALISEKQNFISLEANISNLEKFKVLYKDLEDILNKINNLFVNSEVPIEFITFLEDTSEKCQLKIEIIPSSDKKTEEKGWSYLNFQINTTGSFPNFMKFLEKLENSSYLIEVQSLSINKLAQGETGASNVRANFSVKVFVK